MKSGRGGKRTGAGRKPGSLNRSKGAKITATVKPETKAWLNRQDLSQGKMIDKLVDDAKDKTEVMR